MNDAPLSQSCPRTETATNCRCFVRCFSWAEIRTAFASTFDQSRAHQAKSQHGASEHDRECEGGQRFHPHICLTSSTRSPGKPRKNQKPYQYLSKCWSLRRCGLISTLVISPPHVPSSGRNYPTPVPLPSSRPPARPRSCRTTCRFVRVELLLGRHAGRVPASPRRQ